MPFDDADRIFNSEKRLLGPFRWESVPNSSANEHRRRFETRVTIGNGIRRGVFFRIIVYPRSLTRLTYQLDCDLPAGRTHVPLYRFELNPPRPHANKPYGPDEINGLFIDAGVPHEHVFYDSLRRDGTLRNEACEQGRIVGNPPSNFANALEYVCRKVNIVNCSDVPNPGDQGQLL